MVDGASEHDDLMQFREQK